MRLLRVLASLTILFSLFALPAAAFADTGFGQFLGQLEQEYQLPSGILWKVALVENGGKATGCSSSSSACGMYQFISSTWESATKAMFGQPLNPDLRNSPDVSAKVAAFELATIKSQIGGIITQAKVDPSAGLYLGHFLGSGGARVLLQAYMQNPSQNACALLASACASNRSVLSTTIAGVINWASQKMQVTGVPNVPGNFADSQGISYAYSYADIASSNFLPANTVIPANPYGQYATVFPSAAASPVMQTTPLGTTIPTTMTSPIPVTQPTPAATPPTAGIAANGTSNTSSTGACTPQYYCSNNTVYYRSDSCQTSTFQACLYGCSGTICAPPPTGASSTASLYNQSPNGSSVSLTAGTIGNPILVASNSANAPLSPLLNSSINTIIAGASSTAYGQLSTSATTSYGSVSTYGQDTLTQNQPYQPYQASSPIFGVLNQLKNVLTTLLSYLTSM